MARPGSAARPPCPRPRSGPGSGSRRRSRRRPRPAPPPGSRTPRARRASPGHPAPWRRSGSSRRPRRCSAPSRSTRTSLDESLGAAAVANSSIEGDHDQLLDPEALDHVSLDLERHDQLRQRRRVQDLERVRIEGEDGVGALDHRLVAEVDAVEGPDRDVVRGAGSASGRGVTLIGPSAGTIAAPPPPREPARRRRPARSPRRRPRPEGPDRDRGAAPSSRRHRGSRSASGRRCRREHSIS